MNIDVPRELLYAGALVVGVLFVTPAVGLTLSALGAPTTPILLITLALVLGLYGVAVLALDDIYRGLLVMVLVLATVHANVPFGTIPEGTLDVGPQLFLVDVPVVLFVAITASSWSRRHFTAPLTLLLLFAGWCLLLIPVAPGPRSDVMGWYAVHVGRYALVGLAVVRGVVDDHLTGREALGVIGVTAVGHAVVATIQIVTGPIQTLSVLGANNQIVASLGSIPTGPYVGGFMGGAPLAVFLTLLLPAVAGIGAARRRLRIPALLVVVWWALLLQFTAWDAVRGALIVAIGIAFFLLGWWLTGVLWDRAALLSQIQSLIDNSSATPTALLSAVGIAAIVQLVTGRGTVAPKYIGPDAGQAWAEAINIPGFSTQNLAIRIYQYVTGIDVFLQYPLTGVGGANFAFVSEAYGRGITMHNVYIGTLAETGVIGAICLFGALWIAGRRLWWLAQMDDDPVFIGLLAGFVGVLAMQFFQPQYLRIPSMLSLWVVLGSVVGEVRRRRGPPDDYWGQAWAESRLTTALSTAAVTNAGQWVADRATGIADTAHSYFEHSVTARLLGKFY
jgi:hypothetical protein